MEKKQNKYIDKFKEYLFILLISIGGLLILLNLGIHFLRPEIYNVNIDFLNKLFNIGVAIISPGVFAAVLKYFQFMGIFENEISKIMDSTKFKNTIQNSINNTVYSKSFLSNQKDLLQIWKNATLCLFESYFPNIATSMEGNLENTFFNLDNIQHYYKNYNVKLKVNNIEDTHLEFIEISTYKIIRPNKERFKLDFKYFIPSTLNDTKSAINVNEIKVDGKDYPLTDNGDDFSTTDIIDYEYVLELENKTEYTINQKITLTYPINLDREFTFKSSRIIEDLTVELIVDKSLCYIFVPISEQSMSENKEGNQHSITFRGLLQPNSGFKTFFFHKNKNITMGGGIHN